MLKSFLRVALTLTVFGIAVLVGYRLWAHYMYSPWTRDGRVRADIVAVAPDVGGLVTAVAVRDNQRVNQGDLLFQIDPARYQLAITQAQAALAAAKAEYAVKESEANRRARLGAAVVSQENQESTRARANAAAAGVQQAQAALALAQLNLQRTAVRARVDGYVTNLRVEPGDYAVAGHPMLALVDRHSFRVEGYFEETKIGALQVGAAVDIRLMSDGRHLKGHIASIAHAIADPENAGLLSAVNPTFHWVRLAQRIPVRVALDDVPADLRLASGMTCTLTVQPTRVKL